MRNNDGSHDTPMRSNPLFGKSEMPRARLDDEAYKKAARVIEDMAESREEALELFEMLGIVDHFIHGSNRVVTSLPLFNSRDIIQ